LRHELGESEQSSDVVGSRLSSQRRTVGYLLDSPFSQDGNAIREKKCFPEVVRDEHGCWPLPFTDGPQLTLQLGPRDCVESAKGLVEQQQFLTGGERARHCDSLSLSARELVRPPLSHHGGIEANNFEGARGARFGVGHFAEHWNERDIPRDSPMRKNAAVLRHISNRLAQDGLVAAKGAEKSYALLREAIRKSGVVGIGKVIIRQSQHLAGIKVLGEALVLEIMRFSNELVDASEYTFPSRENVRPQEVKMAEQLIENLAEPFDPSRYTDDYRANVMKLIKAKMRGKKIKVEEPEEEAADTNVLDLMSKLRASLEQGTGKKSARGKRSGAAAKPKSTKTSKRKTA